MMFPHSEYDKAFLQVWDLETFKTDNHIAVDILATEIGALVSKNSNGSFGDYETYLHVCYYLRHKFHHSGFFYIPGVGKILGRYWHKQRSGFQSAEDYYSRKGVMVNSFPPIIALNDHICHTCHNDRVSRSETSCWKCGGKL